MTLTYLDFERESREAFGPHVGKADIVEWYRIYLGQFPASERVHIAGDQRGEIAA